jgi:acetoin:2,6-dichlorophenolindophenol oxidoreductase subunit beta
MPETTYIKALNQALAEEMRRDPSVYVLGEDVAEGGPYGATRDLAGEFGRRVRNTPISEGTITGVAVGMALLGLRPVLEIMFVDFITLALDQLVNQAAKAHYMSGGQLRVPLVIRTQGGSGLRYGAQHSQSLETWMLHVPGLKVVMPASAVDAAGLLKAAIRDDNPVIVVENKALYSQRESVPDSLEPVPLGRAVIRRPGSHLTIVATSRMVWEALAAADQLADEGVEAEVIDPRTLFPLDLDTIVASLERTHHLLVAHEAVGPLGFGAELIARVQEAAFDELDAPMARVTAPFSPVPVSARLEDAYRPSKENIVVTAHKVLQGLP